MEAAVVLNVKTRLASLKHQGVLTADHFVFLEYKT